MRLITRLYTALLSLGLLFAVHGNAQEMIDQGDNSRTMLATIEAEVTAIDLETRQVTLQGPMGESVTVTAPEAVVKLEDVSIGDVLSVNYIASLEAELREPTAEELDEPWLVLADGGVADTPSHPTVGGARMIRAVCTIEGMNRLLGTVVIMDPRGKVHLIEAVEPEKMAGVTLGQTVVLVYTEALAVSLDMVGES